MLQTISLSRRFPILSLTPDANPATSLYNAENTHTTPSSVTIHLDNDSRQILKPEITKFSISDNHTQRASEVTPTNASLAPNPEPRDPSPSHGLISEESGEETTRPAQDNDNVDDSMVLGVVTCEGNDKDIPVIIIIHDEENEEELPRLAQFPVQVTHSDEFVLIVAEGDTSMCAGDIPFSVNKTYFKHVISGTSIEAKQHGTVGLFVEDRENNFVGITCAHVAGTTEEKRHISQPTVENLKDYIRGFTRSVYITTDKRYRNQRT